MRRIAFSLVALDMASLPDWPISRSVMMDRTPRQQPAPIPCPTSFHRAKFGRSDGCISTLAAEKVKQSGHGHKPTLPLRKTTKQLFCPGLNFAFFHEAACEMCVHDADTTFSFQLFLICLTDCLTEARRIRSVTATKPVFYEGSKRVSIGIVGLTRSRFTSRKTKFRT